MFLTYIQRSYPAFWTKFDLQRQDVLEGPIDFVIVESLVTFLAGEITGNSSHVDRVWTFLPPLYTAYFTFLPLFSWAPPDLKAAGVSNRALLMLATQCIWSLRLSFNTWRRDLFKLSEEDYRWALLRDHIPPVFYTLFNFGFIAFIQHFLLFAQGLPAYAATLQPRTAPTTSDQALFALGVVTVLIQFIADNQQWTYQNFKRGNKLEKPWPFADCNWTELDAKRGFVAEGLWSISRHPNFLCEQLFWFWTALYPILGEPSHSGTLSTTPISYLPPLSIAILFASSTAFTEYVTSGKYVAYAFYQERVGMFSPFTTLLKKIWLGSTGRLATVDAAIWKDEKKRE
ncbi:hypothetical protein M407DRAFT_16643 [Tulasnella calospora MUT 4182]|uniref:Steroid 5-alpha reductase C-terminal domain-containing protein n=1 Tax=Tulasnella calospora MUT 4182 TaxID=1051891 RepID=A0A0C3QNB9_9AGAM|nr:hypothetical protein M407DRAFT_16643 [Tulasnella calospora MUT 4182]